MRTFLGLLLLTMTAIVFSACPESATPTNTDNSNAGNENVATATAPATETNDAVVEVERKAYEAWKNKDGKFFEGMLADNFTSNGNYSDKANVVKSISESPCEVKDVKLEDPETVNLTDDAVLLTNKFVADYACNGKAGLSPTWSASVFVKDGDEWKGAYHQTVPAADAKGEDNVPKVPAAQENATDELTKALSEMENKLWEAWKNKDVEHFENTLSSNYVGVAASGRRDRAGSLKELKDNPCEVKSYSTGGFKATEISENVAVLTYTATQDAKCGEDSLPGLIFSNAVWVKEGDSWKAAFYTERPGA